MDRTKALDSYLNDHLAGAQGSVALAWRTADAQPGDHVLRRLAVDIDDDRRELLDITDQLGIGQRRLRSYAAWIAEKVGRLKTNGSILRRSPLSTLVELEALLMGVRGKAALWHTLRLLAADEDRLDPVRLDQLAQRATEQLRWLEHRHHAAAVDTFGVPSSAAEIDEVQTADRYPR